MAEQAGDGFLMYIIDMAIIQANKQARLHEDDFEAHGARSSRQVQSPPDRRVQN